MIDIPILAYHKISDDKEFGLTTIGIDRFESQLKLLVAEGYETISFKDLKDSCTFSKKKTVILTFDDGYASIYHHAFPLLQKYKLNATVFIVVDYLGKMNDWESYAIQRKYRHLSHSHIIELQKYGFEMGSHTLNHFHLPSCPPSVIRSEINISKKKLEDITGESVLSFCYPYGKYNNTSMTVVKEAGYKYATCNLRFSDRKEYHLFKLPRRTIYSTDSLKSVLTKLRSPREFNFTYLSEWSIQRGALAGIWKKSGKIYSNKLNLP